MIKKGIYAASLSVLNENGTLNINETILHAESAIRSGLHWVFFFGSTGQSQLISINEKKEFIAKIASHKLRKQFFLGTGCNYLYDNIEEQYKENTIFSDILDVLDDKYHLLDNQRDSTYVRLSEQMSLLFDSLVEAFAESKKYLYISPKCFEFQRFYEEDTKETEETEDTEEVDGGECGEEGTEETEEVDDEEETEETKEEEDDKVDSEESDNEDKKNDDKEVIDSMTKLLLNTMTEENKESIIDEALKSDNPKLSLLDLLKED